MTKKDKFKAKKYLHFDNRIEFKNVESYVTNQNKISKHSFFPLIHYTIEYEMYNEDYIDARDDKRPIKEKTRDIMYASHLDNFIYKYYGEELNKQYNEWSARHLIDDCSIAYRDNKLRKSNIDFAAEVINMIRMFKDCFIMVGDFEKFFDRLDHAFLKERIMDVLDVKLLSEDWYKVFKSITQYSYIEKDFLNLKLGTDREIKAKRQFKYFETFKDFRNFKKEHRCVKRNINNFGIPQGSAISAVFANVYTTIFDKKVKTLVDKYSGIYRRYSDDFILIVPKDICGKRIDVDEFMKIVEKTYQFIIEEKLHIQEEKTQLFEINASNIINLSDKTNCKIDYLGFVYDGENVAMRSKSPYKFYRKAYKLIDQAKKIKAKKGLKRIPYKRDIYRLYTDLGVNCGDYGNFITYAKNSQKIFNEVSPTTNNLMLQQIKNRKGK
ncbi:reverse transcriptase domain-containing protein [Solibacillus sp. FSL W7-1464]|uniref:reverse transcriptase domain-containing protein n=1 Tax=Solibacillus sp. FSL W7-1464 TaxID=2921706 RepID=UPI0030F5E1F3